MTETPERELIEELHEALRLALSWVEPEYIHPRAKHLYQEDRDKISNAIEHYRYYTTRQ